jgi:copper resistance protein C
LKIRIRVIVSVILFGLIALPNLTYAHSALVSAVPINTEPSKTEVNQIELKFNTLIEPVSSMKVKDDAGNAYSLKETNTDGKLLIGTLEKPLTDGKYTVDWHIIGADGHAINGSYSFEVNIPEPVPSETVSPRPSDTQGQVTSEPTNSESPSVSPPTETASNAEPEQGSSLKTNNLISNIVLAVAALLLVIAIVFAFMRKKKQ